MDKVPLDLLEGLGLTKEIKSQQSGPEIKEILANLVTKIITDGIQDDKLTENLKLYPRPKNCPALTKVTVNKLIWEMTSATRSTDVELQKIQTNIIGGICALVMAVDKVLDGPSDNYVVKTLMDAVAMIATANHEVNLRRREHIKPELNANYKHLCSATIPITDELFGDDISKLVKDLTEVNRVGRKITGHNEYGYGNYGSRGSYRGGQSYGGHGYGNRGYQSRRGRGRRPF